MPLTQYFLGANSPAGFHSLYHQLSDPAKTDRLYIIKGGPGCGKSSLMKRVSRHARAAGLEAEHILCSGDPDSLDAVIFPQLKTALVDGTAPHVMEAACPGGVETYLDLSRFYDHAGLQPAKDDLLAVTAEYKGHYRQAYRCLGAAGELRRNLSETADSPEVRRRLEKRAAGIIARELKKPPTGSGQVDYRFLSALTHRGRVQLWDTVEALTDRVCQLSDSHGLAHHLLSPILSAAAAAGHDAVACPDPMAPERLAHLILPGLSLAFVTTEKDAPWPHRSWRHLRLDAMAEEELRQASRPRLRFTRRVSQSLVEDGIASLSRAKEAHDRLEALYNPHVDFQGVYALADQLAENIIASR